jgi:hypothetical protein
VTLEGAREWAEGPADQAGGCMGLIQTWPRCPWPPAAGAVQGRRLTKGLRAHAFCLAPRVHAHCRTGYARVWMMLEWRNRLCGITVAPRIPIPLYSIWGSVGQHGPDAVIRQKRPLGGGGHLRVCFGARGHGSQAASLRRKCKPEPRLKGGAWPLGNRECLSAFDATVEPCARAQSCVAVVEAPGR